MARLVYWMVFQILIGLWLAISPYVLGMGGEMPTMTTNNMIFGALVVFLGLGIAFFSDKVCAGIRHGEGKTT